MMAGSAVIGEAVGGFPAAPGRATWQDPGLNGEPLRARMWWAQGLPLRGGPGLLCWRGGSLRGGRWEGVKRKTGEERREDNKMRESCVERWVPLPARPSSRKHMQLV